MNAERLFVTIKGVKAGDAHGRKENGIPRTVLNVINTNRSK